jgi:hypothetical protein
MADKGAMQHISGKKKCWETSLIGSELTLSPCVPYIFTTEQEEEVVTCDSDTE